MILVFMRNPVKCGHWLEGCCFESPDGVSGTLRIILLAGPASLAERVTTKGVGLLNGDSVAQSDGGVATLAFACSATGIRKHNNSVRRDVHIASLLFGIFCFHYKFVAGPAGLLGPA